VHNQIAVVHEYPFPGGISLDVIGRHLLLFQVVTDGIRDGLRLPPLLATADEEQIRKAASTRHVQGDRIGRLFLVGCVSDDF
jgi:hypothetical protein